ncbi:hypothetical protein L6452_36235 [Arctium lappa]|uniref:Uncharacterized protein n=1 Tax=Arctium lappa TaxID=4217 RepID=A0ACB8Y806_ARCLA|nr:hypothetical protein L6452_36235 [Arctium lappa]
MFIPAIEGQGTEEQKRKWLPLAQKMKVIGQGIEEQIELGHGSNVQGLETTATFAPHTDEFVIHNPTLTSSEVFCLSRSTSKANKIWHLVSNLALHVK